MSLAACDTLKPILVSSSFFFFCHDSTLFNNKFFNAPKKIESCENQLELKSFFDQNYSQVYFIFYESFVGVEANLKQKLNKQNKEELETVLFVFQVIFFFWLGQFVLKSKTGIFCHTCQSMEHIPGNNSPIG
jgi:hypothetical protein